MKLFLAVSCLLAVAAANPPSLGLLPIATIGSIPNPGYSFNYAVNDPHTGDNKAQWESRHGDVVKGAYSLVEPDGNIRLVEYTADPHNGFNAVVKRTGPNVHSVGVPVLAPIQPVITKTIAPIAPLALEHNIIEPYIDNGALLAEHGPLLGGWHGASLDSYPAIGPLPSLDLLPLGIDNGPYVHLTGTSYGHKGNIVRRWAAGPISLNGKTLTIKTKH